MNEVLVVLTLIMNLLVDETKTNYIEMGIIFGEKGQRHQSNVSGILKLSF